MPLSGTFDTVSLSGVLQLLCTEKLSGILRATNNKEEFQLFISDGSIIYASESKKEDRLGSYLRRKGIMDELQLRECLSEARKKKQALGKIVVDKGFITLEMLEKVIYKQVEDIMFYLFLWEKGTFEFRMSKLNLQWMVVTKLSIMELVLSASRRADEMVILKEKLPDPNKKLKITKKSPTKEDNLSSQERLIYALVIDGDRSIRQIIMKSGYDDQAVYKAVDALLTKGIIQFK